MNIGIYERLKISRLYDMYCLLFKREFFAGKNQEIQFYRSILRDFIKGDLILDIGANVGDKTALFLKLGARVVSVEPDPTNQDTLKKRFHAFRLFKLPVAIVGKAVSDKTGFETMWVEKPGWALNTLSSKWVETLRNDVDRFKDSHKFTESKTVETTTVEELFKSFGVPYFVKIDVEGHEARVLSGMRTAVPFVSFEVNLPEFRSEGLQCVELLGTIAPVGTFNYMRYGIPELTFEDWLPRSEFIDALNECKDRSVEVFWRSGL